MYRFRHRRTHLYFAGFMATAGVWLWWNFSDFSSGITLCFFKTATGLPCPSCGTTRALDHLLHGNLALALVTNPLGILMALVLSLGGIILISDFLTGQNRLDRLFGALNHNLRKAVVFVPLIAVIIMNWIWNINKGL